MRNTTLMAALALGLPCALGGCEPAQRSPADGSASLAPDPVAKAGMELATAQRQEAARKTADAAATYERIVKQYAGSPQANFAAQRLAALRGKKR